MLSTSSGEDFIQTTRSLTFDSVTSSITVQVPIITDPAVEPTENFNGNLQLISTDADGVTIAPDVADIEIIDTGGK